jgi:hypothetical protein
MTDIEKLAAGLTPNMVKSLTWWCHDGGISSDVEDATKRALVKRGLTAWASGERLTLTELGGQVREVLLARQQAEEESEKQALRDRNALVEKGRGDAEKSCVLDLYRAVYGNDSWPDRPLDTIWNHLIEKVRGAFGQEEVA